MVTARKRRSKPEQEDWEPLKQTTISFLRRQEDWEPSFSNSKSPPDNASNEVQSPPSTRSFKALISIPDGGNRRVCCLFCYVTQRFQKLAHTNTATLSVIAFRNWAIPTPSLIQCLEGKPKPKPPHLKRVIWMRRSWRVRDVYRSWNVICCKCTTFKALSACLRQSRTKALDLPADQEMRLLFDLSALSWFQPPHPTGYCGNAISFACAEAKARDLTPQPLYFAVKLINEAHRRVG